MLIYCNGISKYLEYNLFIFFFACALNFIFLMICLLYFFLVLFYI